MTRKQLLLTALCLVAVLGYGAYEASQNRAAMQSSLTAQSQSAGPNATRAVLGAQTKATGCIVHGALPDSACTPGAVIPTATADQICKSGYSKSVRNVPSAVKSKVFREYGISSHASGEYEVDHLISLELGGSNDIANLWPQAAEPTPGFHQKDVVENYLHAEVCAGRIPLAQAQQQISGNWLNMYKNVQ